MTGNGSFTTIGWDDRRIDILKRLWSDGLSAAQIAKQLGGLTRNAVIGKVHRLGLVGRAAPTTPGVPHAPRPTPRPRRAPRRLTRPLIINTDPVPAPPPPPDGVKPAHFREGAAPDRGFCQWPIGDPRLEGFGFCSARSAVAADGAKRSYCVAHCRIAYQPQTAAQRSSLSNLARSLRRYL